MITADKKLPLNLQQIINRMLKREPEDRVSMEMVHSVFESALYPGSGTTDMRDYAAHWNGNNDDDIRSWLKPAGDL